MELTLPSLTRDAALRSAAPEPGFAIHMDEGPWIEGEPGGYNKYMLFDLRKNSFVTLFKLDPGRTISAHFHAGSVIGHVLQGCWKYLEYDWVAEVGSTVFEPPGEVHTLTNPGTVPMISVFHVVGPYILVDKDGSQTSYGDAFTVRDSVLAYCRKHGVEHSFIARITR